MTPAQKANLQTLTDAKGDPITEAERAEVTDLLNFHIEELFEPGDQPIRAPFDAYAVSELLGCQARPKAAFEWTPGLAAKPITVEAVKLCTVLRRPAPPQALVDMAVESIDGAFGVGEWLDRAPEAAILQAKADAVAQVAEWLEMWPPMDAGWWPTCGAKPQAQVGKVAMKAKVDLQVGKTENRVLIGFGRGLGKPQDFEPLAHAALVETLRTGVAPRALVAARPEAARIEARPVTAETLQGAARRLVAAVGETVYLNRGGTPRKRPGPLCRSCPALMDCDEGLGTIQAEGE